MADQEKLTEFFAEFCNTGKSKANSFFEPDKLEIKDLIPKKICPFSASIKSNFKVKMENIDNILIFREPRENIG